MFQPRVVLLAVCGALLSLAAAPAGAQGMGKIGGTVRVANGEAITGAAVTVTNQDTGAKQTVTSVAGGAYETPDLPPGLYMVSADVQGFRGVVVRDQRVEAGATHTVNIALQVKFSEAVTVSAMKRDETIQNTPISVAAPSEETLRERGAQNIEDVAANVAGFSVQNLGPGQSTVAIRGISSGQIARDQPGVKEEVSSYLDESVISLSLFTPDIDLFDMNRVEVLRGPQGTLFGSGSLGGTVRYITNQPQLGVSSVFGEIGGNTVDSGGTGGDFKVGFNAPLSNNVALRVTSYYNRLAGWTDAVQPFGSETPGKFSLHKNVNAGDREGVRVALALNPIEGLTITPRFVYQKVDMDGWDRTDVFNILANPYTTTRPAVTLGGDKQFTQTGEPYTDKFQLGDLDVKWDLGSVLLTSVTSFTGRDIDVVRDAGALTSSITGGSVGLPEDVYTLNAPLSDLTTAHGWTQELRLSGGTAKDRVQWVVGGFYSDSRRHYGQHLLVSGSRPRRHPHPGAVRPDRQPLLVGPELQEQAVLDLRRGDRSPTAWTSPPACATTTTRKTRCRSSTASSAPTRRNSPDPAGQRQGQRLGAPLHRELQRQRQHDDQRPGLEGIPPRRRQRSAQRQPLHSPGPRDVLRPGLLERRDGLELRDRLEVHAHGPRHLQRVGLLQRRQGPPGDGDGRLVLVPPHLQRAEIAEHRRRARDLLDHRQLRLLPLGRLQRLEGPGRNDRRRRPASCRSTGIVAGTGCRPRRSSRRLRRRPTSSRSDGSTGYLTGTYQYIGSRYTQIGDQEPGIGLVDLNSFGANTIGGPLTQSTFPFNPLLPAYDIVNLRLGFARESGISRCTEQPDERTRFLALDQERGTRARVGFLTNQPRTIGINSRVDF